VGGAIRAVGWAIDQNLRDGIEARIFVDERPMVSTLANIDRPDVGAAYPYYGSAHGFDTTIDCEPGRHVVCVLAYDQGSRTTSFIAFSSIEVAGPVGQVDTVTPAPGGAVVSGWVVDPRHPADPASIRISVDGAVVADSGTGAPRPDVNAGRPDFNLFCGFVVPIAVARGVHTVCVDLLYPSGRTARLSCSEVNVP
jgi:hypothetical protein